ncbi:hypothetical protein C9F11_10075 [Streptomyces sp. YIM 121038]|uniref:hypothetical protein n=1 Tax=Streptomyces sp. YIM 121038 TaxID=2136401 RepID=UPI0011104491|nr:hypothetical protein [Streptomyces sp. YIM 121038]QCX75698.1 hypothetical protein C9F11_10075 [Streptomyces sp. YIM 121038]
MTQMRSMVSGGFVVEREFGFHLESRFPGIDLSDVDTSGLALVVRVGDPRKLNVWKLGRLLIGAASGGVKTAVVVRPGCEPVALPVFALWMHVDASQEERAQLQAEYRVRLAA